MDFNFPRIETEWTKKLLEEHLIYRPISKLFPAFIIPVILIIGLLINEFLETNSFFLFLLSNIVFIIALIFIILIALKTSKKQQAIFLMLVSRMTLGIMGFIMFLMGPIKMLMGNMKEGWAILILGICFFPGVDFLKSMKPYNNYLTIIRIIITPICIFVTL